MANNQYNSKIVLGDGTVLIDLTADTVAADKLLSGYTAHRKDGAPITGSCDYDSDTSGDDATAAELLSGKKAHARGTQLTGTMPNNGAVAGKITTKAGAYTVPQGYHDGSGTVALDATEQAKIIPENIRQGVTVLGVEGSMSGSEDINAQSKSATPSWSQQTILPDTGYTHLTSVVIAAIPISYVDNAAGGKTVTIG